MSHELPVPAIDNAPVRFDAERKHRFLTAYRLTGALQKSARAAGIAPTTVRMHLKNDPDFKDAYDEAYEDYKELLESEAMRRAIEGWDEPVYQQGQFAGVVRRFDSRLLELMLKRHIPQYKEKFLVDVNPGGILAVPMPVTAAEWEKQYALDPDKEAARQDATPIEEQENGTTD